MNKSDNPHRIRAGHAFVTEMESYPKTKAGWARARLQLQVFWKAMQAATNSPEYRVADEAERRQWQDLTDAVRRSIESARDDLEAMNFKRPATADDWEHLARIVEIPFETIQSGKLTYREIYACGLAWADREKWRADLNKTPTESRSPDAVPEHPHVADATLLSPRTMADTFNVPFDALNSRLQRFRIQPSNAEGWIENSDRKPREAQYLFKYGAVRHIIEDLIGKQRR